MAAARASLVEAHQTHDALNETIRTLATELEREAFGPSTGTAAASQASQPALQAHALVSTFDNLADARVEEYGVWRGALRRRWKNHHRTDKPSPDPPRVAATASRTCRCPAGITEQCCEATDPIT
ncbi:hypothetical protein [Nonomuraea polychroma]|uniref:hypothetical protein n=1 Tax=Nonomuraea polychroma TaxID=46176 RepID=UPI000FDE807C|nr:hypothetical protein [Nonomuraea polychroma]